MQFENSKRQALRLAGPEVRFRCCGLAALLLAGCVDSPVSKPVVATVDEPPMASSEVVRAAEEMARASVPRKSAAGAGAGGKAGTLGGAAAARTAAGNSGQANTAADDDAGIAGAAGMSAAAPVASKPALTGNDVYLDEGVRPPGVRRCYTKESNDHPAIVRFRQVFHSADYAARDSTIAQLEAAVKEHPDEEQYVLFLGLAYLWRVKEPHDLLGQLQTLESAVKSEDALKRAYEICPTDHRIPGWLGPTQIIMGNRSGDAALLDEGSATFRKGIEHYPMFVLFSEVMIYADLPQDDPQFQQAFASFRRLFTLPLEINTCNEWKLDPACINTPAAQYNVEAGGLYAGDMYARGQDREGALAWYRTAMSSPDWVNPAWNQWRYRDLLEERIRSVDQRMKAAASASTTDDLESVWNAPNACTICHAK